MSSVRPHVPEEELHAFRDGELSPAQRAEIAEHLVGCLLCRAQDAEVEALRGRTAALLALAVPRTTRRAASRRQIVPAAWARSSKVPTICSRMSTSVSPWRIV